MYVAQFRVPLVQVENKSKADSFLVNTLFAYLHRKAHAVEKEYKYILSFPQLNNEDKSMGEYVQIFTHKQDELLKHITTHEVLNIVGNHCYDLKIEKVNIDDVLKYEKFKIIHTKKNNMINNSEIKRLVKRGSGEIFSLYQKYKDVEKVKEVISANIKDKENKSFYIQYRSISNNNNISFFLSKKEVKEQIDEKNMLNIDGAGSFGLNNDIILTSKIF